MSAASTPLGRCTSHPVPVAVVTGSGAGSGAAGGAVTGATPGGPTGGGAGAFGSTVGRMPTTFAPPGPALPSLGVGAGGSAPGGPLAPYILLFAGAVSPESFAPENGPPGTSDFAPSGCDCGFGIGASAVSVGR